MSAENLACLFAVVPLSLFAGVLLARIMPNDTLQYSMRALQREVNELRARLDRLELQRSVAPPPPAAIPIPDSPPPEPGVAPSVSPSFGPAPIPQRLREPLLEPLLESAPPKASGPVPVERLVVWVGASLGALLLAIGGLFGIIAATEAGWFGPGVRVAAGMVFGTAAWVGGAVAHEHARRAGSALSAAGASILFGTVWAATNLYGFVPSTVGFLLLVVVVGATFATADRFRDRYLGALAVFGGLLASTVVHGDGAAPRLAYALVLNAAVVWAAARREWPEMLGLVGGGTALQLGTFSLNAAPVHQQSALVGVAALTLPFALVSAFRRDRILKNSAIGVACLYILVASRWNAAADNPYDRAGAWAAGLATLAVMLPAWLAQRGPERAESSEGPDPWVTLVVPVTAGLLPLVTFAMGWDAVVPARTALPVAAVVAGTVGLVNRRSVGAGLMPLFGVAPLLLPLTDGPVAEVVLAMILLAGMAVLAGKISSHHLAGTVSLVPTGLAAVVLAMAHRGSPAVGAMIAVLTFVYVVPDMLHRAKRNESPWFGVLVAPTVLLPAALLWWRSNFGDETLALVPLATAAVTFGTAAYLVRVRQLEWNSAPFAAATIGILGGITLAIPLQLHERWLAVGWAIESAALALITTRWSHPIVRYASTGLGVVVAGLLLLNPFALSWGDGFGGPILNWTLYTWGVPTGCLVLAAYALERSASSAGDRAPTVLRALAVLTGFALVNLEVSHWFHDSGALRFTSATTMQAMVRSLSWGGYGLLLLLFGLRYEGRTMRVVGFVFVLLGALKVFLVDMWNLTGLLRVGSLLGLGLFLVASAFAFERLVLRSGRVDEPR